MSVCLHLATVPLANRKAALVDSSRFLLLLKRNLCSSRHPRSWFTEREIPVHRFRFTHLLLSNSRLILLRPASARNFSSKVGRCRIQIQSSLFDIDSLRARFHLHRSRLLALVFAAHSSKSSNTRGHKRTSQFAAFSSLSPLNIETCNLHGIEFSHVNEC